MASIKQFFDDIKNFLLFIFGLVSVIFIALFTFEKKKEEVQEALKIDAKTDEKVDSINNQITNVENNEKEKENEQVSKQELLDFLNNKSNKS